MTTTTTSNYDDLVTMKQSAEQFGVSLNAVHKWRFRYDDFPEPAVKLDSVYLYRISDLWDWYMAKWPDRVGQLQVYLHRTVVDETGVVLTDTSQFGLAPEARGYIKAVRDLQYENWKVWSTSMGFVAEQDTNTHIWALDPSSEPEDWFIYEQRYKTAGRREK